MLQDNRCHVGGVSLIVEFGTGQMFTLSMGWYAKVAAGAGDWKAASAKHLEQAADTSGMLGHMGLVNNWVAVKELKSSYHDSETILFRICPHYGNLNQIP